MNSINQLSGIWNFFEVKVDANSTELLIVDEMKFFFSCSTFNSRKAAREMIRKMADRSSDRALEIIFF